MNDNYHLLQNQVEMLREDKKNLMAEVERLNNTTPMDMNGSNRHNEEMRSGRSNSDAYLERNEYTSAILIEEKRNWDLERDKLMSRIQQLESLLRIKEYEYDQERENYYRK